MARNTGHGSRRSTWLGGSPASSGVFHQAKSQGGRFDGVKPHRTLYDPRDGQIPPPPQIRGVVEIFLLVTLLALVAGSVLIAALR